MPRRAGGRFGLLSVLLAGLGLLLAGCGTAASPRAEIDDLDDDHGYHGAWVEPPYDVPRIALTDTAGERYVVAEDRPELTLVFFGYTRCPDVCQVVMSTLTAAVARLSPADRRRVQVAFVTTDPARDTRAVLRRYLDRFDPGFVGLTGPLSDVDALGRPLGVYIRQGERLPSGGYEVEHGASVTAVRGGTAPLLWTPGVRPAQVAADLHRLLAS
ncbi:MAG TPA: SCO family protein [Marmoricola sp.]|nr:SCO family protein [Marmoricola sp.]